MPARIKAQPATGTVLALLGPQMKPPTLHIYLVEAENYARHIVARWLGDRGHRVSLLSAPEQLLPALAADPDPTDLIQIGRAHV